jgi:nitrite reductase/ring-hydroxylating ferredoxin subunit
MASPESDLVGVYERKILAGIERIWENVRDWEHLPWLHAGAFESVELVEEGEGGWSADVGFAGGGDKSRIRVALDIPASRYTTSTVSGAGAGTDIVTVLSPDASGATDIEVSFYVPGIAAADREAVFGIYRDLYRTLWDEDEEMMRARQSFLDGVEARRGGREESSELDLGDIERLRGELPKLVVSGGDTFRVVEVGGEIVAHSVFCPHVGGPLGETPCDDEGVVVCPWHGYRFDVRSGACVHGGKFRLAAAPSVHVDSSTGAVTLKPSR